VLVPQFISSLVTTLSCWRRYQGKISQNHAVFLFFRALLPLPGRFPFAGSNSIDRASQWTMEGAPTPVPRDAHACGGSCESSPGVAPGAACAAGARPPASPQTPDLESMRHKHFAVPAGRALSMSAAPPAPITRADLTRAFQTQQRLVQEATSAGTLKEFGTRTLVRQHIVIGLAPVQVPLGQQNTVHRSNINGRPDTVGGQVSPHIHGPAQNAHGRSLCI